MKIERTQIDFHVELGLNFEISFKFILIIFEISYNLVFNPENNKYTVYPPFDLNMIVLMPLVRGLISPHPLLLGCNSD